jgi:hypothetical protein
VAAPSRAVARGASFSPFKFRVIGDTTTSTSYGARLDEFPAWHIYAFALFIIIVDGWEFRLVDVFVIFTGVRRVAVFALLFGIVRIGVVALLFGIGRIGVVALLFGIGRIGVAALLFGIGRIGAFTPFNAAGVGTITPFDIGRVAALTFTADWVVPRQRGVLKE